MTGFYNTGFPIKLGMTKSRLGMTDSRSGMTDSRSGMTRKTVIPVKTGIQKSRNNTGFPIGVGNDR